MCFDLESSLPLLIFLFNYIFFYSGVYYDPVFRICFFACLQAYSINTQKYTLYACVSVHSITGSNIQTHKHDAMIIRTKNIYILQDLIRECTNHTRFLFLLHLMQNSLDLLQMLKKMVCMHTYAFEHRRKWEQMCVTFMKHSSFFLFGILHLLPFIVSLTAVETGSIILFSSFYNLLSAMESQSFRVLSNIKETAFNPMPDLLCAI